MQMEAILNMGTLLMSAITFTVALLIWVVRAIFGHNQRISANETAIGELKKIEIETKITNHENRISVSEKNIDSLSKMHRSYDEKLTDIKLGVARIEGMLSGKKDKE